MEGLALVRVRCVVAVIGNGGGGKSTLARAVGEQLGLRVFEVDSVQWLPGWRRAPIADVSRELAAWAARDAWIIDGFGPPPVIEARFDRADTIVYVDLPFRTHIWWAAKRQVASWLSGRAWAGQRRPPPSRLLFNTLVRVDRMRLALYESMTSYGRAAKLVHLRSPRAMREWLATIGARPANG